MESDMLRIDKNGKKLIRLQKSALAEADHWERELQAMILAAPDSFCEEIGESLWLIGQEVRPSEAVPDRIDILAIDEAANSVIIELKRGTHNLSSSS
jgi:RecB family endonuclease NucS